MYGLVVAVILLSSVTDIQSRYLLFRPRPGVSGTVSHRKIVATWDEAKRRCEKDGAVLASPIDEGLLEYMKSSIGVNNHTMPYFIGMKAVGNPELIFVSVEGVLLGYLPDGAIDMIEELEPKVGDCLSMDRNSIRVMTCRARLPYLCYIPNAKIVTSKETTTEATTQKITEVTTQVITQATTEETREVITQATTEETTEVITQATTEETSEVTMQATTEETSETTMQATTEETSEVTMQTTTEETSETTMQATTEETSETTMQATTEETSEVTMQATTEETSELTMQATTEETSETTMQATTEETSEVTMQTTTEETSEVTMQATTEETSETTMQATTEAISEITTLESTETSMVETLSRITTAKPFKRTGYKLYSTGSYYKVHLEKKGWDEAQSTCTSEGAYLAIINNEKEARVVRKFAFSATRSSWVTIGLRDFSENGTWKSVHDEPIKQLFNTWAPSRSNDRFCGSLKKTGKLDDQRCGAQYPFVCERTLEK